MAQGRECGWGQRVGGKIIPLGNSLELGQLKPIMKLELDLQGLRAGSIDTIWGLTFKCENIVLNHCIFQFCHTHHGATNTSLYYRNVRHRWSMFVKCEMIKAIWSKLYHLILPLNKTPSKASHSCVLYRFSFSSIPLVWQVILCNDTNARNIQKNLQQVGAGSQTPFQWLGPPSLQSVFLYSWNDEHNGPVIQQHNFCV